MADKILKSFEVWIAAQGIKSRTRLRSVDNVSCKGVTKLRELILELAIRGKLVTHEGDVDSRDLLDKLAKGKQKLVAKYELKNYKALPEVNADEIPFDVPKSWVWLRLGNVGITQTGGTPDKNDKSYFGDDIPFIKPGDIFPKHVDYSNEGLSKKGAEKLGRIAPENSILMVCIGTIGKCNYIERPCAFNQQINSLTPFIDITKYLLVAMQSKYFQDILWQKSSSTTIAILNKGKWENCFIPLPPLTEQHRIVAKIEELMALCDELEKQETHHLHSHALLVETLLGTLTQAKDAREFQQAWSLLAQHFGDLFTTEDSIDQLKQTILQLAVMGKLVPQDPKDEPASVLLERIREEKERLVEDGIVKRQKDTLKIEDDEKLFELPLGWQWARLNQIGRFSGGGTPSMSRAEYWNGNIPWISPKDMGEKYVSDSEMKITSVGVDNSTAKLIPKGSLLIVARSGILKRKLPVAINTVDCTVNQDIKVLIPYLPEISEFIHLMFSGMEKYILENYVKIGTTVHSLKYESFEIMPVPIPPVRDQVKIISKVNELFALCDDLKARLAAAQTLANQMAEAVVEQV